MRTGQRAINVKCKEKKKETKKKKNQQNTGKRVRWCCDIVMPVEWLLMRKKDTSSTVSLAAGLSSNKQKKWTVLLSFHAVAVAATFQVQLTKRIIAINWTHLLENPFRCEQRRNECCYSITLQWIIHGTRTQTDTVVDHN